MDVMACRDKLLMSVCLDPSVQPLAGNGLLPQRVLLVDNEARKAAPGEETSLVEMPTWEKCTGGQRCCPFRGSEFPVGVEECVSLALCHLPNSRFALVADQGKSSLRRLVELLLEIAGDEEIMPAFDFRHHSARISEEVMACAKAQVRYWPPVLLVCTSTPLWYSCFP